jgi:16S rRNA (guanine(527)-N(7))-methyltransferase RsmG
VFPDLLRQRLEGIVDLSSGQVAALEAHYELLLRWNPRLNLTTVIELHEAVERHYAESLFLGKAINVGVQRIVDVGSGAGFPGFPVAILRPECEVTLVESHQRKAVFLKEAARSLRNVRVLAKRAEDVEGGFDWLISRAVSYADLQGLLPRLAPQAALLSGVEEPSDGLGLQWSEPVVLPWGRQRYLRIGSAVSRET